MTGNNKNFDLKSIDPKLIIVLLAVIALAMYMKISNPYKQYSSKDYWYSASLADVVSIPEEALLPNNKHGSVLLWAAMAVDDPAILAALVARGQNVNEAEIDMGGTPLSAAATYTDNPLIIDELIRLGAEVDKVVGSNNKTPLIIAAELNPNADIAARLIHHGADINYRDLTGRTALEQAMRFDNTAVVALLEKQRDDNIDDEASDDRSGSFGDSASTSTRNNTDDSSANENNNGGTVGNGG